MAVTATPDHCTILVPAVAAEPPKKENIRSMFLALAPAAPIIWTWSFPVHAASRLDLESAPHKLKSEGHLGREHVETGRVASVLQDPAPDRQIHNRTAVA